MSQFNVTYDKIVPGSPEAESGDCSEIGYLDASGFAFPIEAGTALLHNAERQATLCRVRERCSMSLRQARESVGAVEDAGRAFYETDGSTDFRSGIVTRRAVHPPEGVTASSYRRIARVLGASAR